MPSRRLCAVLFVMLCQFAPWGGARAQVLADLFTVRGVEVDVTAASAQAAKEQALKEAQAKAFGQLLDRMVAPADRPALARLSAAAFVRDYSVEQERSSSVRYIATLTVSFNPTLVRKALRDAGVSFTDMRSRPVVLLPVLKAGGRTLLWEDGNAWRVAWQTVGGGALVPLILPRGDATDVQTVSADQALAADPAALAAEGMRWHTPDVMVLAATLSPDGRRLDVAVSGTPSAPVPFASVSYDLKAGETADQMLIRAVGDLGRAIDAGYRQTLQAGGGGGAAQGPATDALSVIAPLDGFDTWLAIRDRLARVSMVRSTELISLTRTEAALVLHASAETDQVKTALAGAGLTLDWNDGGYWTMRVAAQH
jgi:hypothetical protein